MSVARVLILPPFFSRAQGAMLNLNGGDSTQVARRDQNNHAKVTAGQSQRAMPTRQAHILFIPSMFLSLSSALSRAALNAGLRTVTGHSAFLCAWIQSIMAISGSLNLRSQ